MSKREDFPSLTTKTSIINRSLSKIIRRRDWAKFRKLLSSKEILIAQCDSSSDPHNHFGGILLLACRYDPPTDIIALLINENPSALYETCGDNRFPLHVACANGASSHVIKQLLEANKEATYQRDKHGMLPIHIACRHEFSGAWRPEDISSYESQVQTLKYLIKAAPDTLLEVDENGKCSIEHALESGTHIDIIRSLQDINQKIQRAISKS